MPAACSALASLRKRNPMTASPLLGVEEMNKKYRGSFT